MEWLTLGIFCAALIACNQTLATMLEQQLCQNLADSDSNLAIDIEDSAVIIAPMIPWSIAGAVPLSSHRRANQCNSVRMLLVSASIVASCMLVCREQEIPGESLTCPPRRL